jgi:hypothetical protein
VGSAALALAKLVSLDCDIGEPLLVGGGRGAVMRLGAFLVKASYQLLAALALALRASPPFLGTVTSGVAPLNGPPLLLLGHRRPNYPAGEPDMR